jgi:hypothetical protein
VRSEAREQADARLLAAKLLAEAALAGFTLAIWDSLKTLPHYLLPLSNSKYFLECFFQRIHGEVHGFTLRRRNPFIFWLRRTEKI